MDNSRLSRHNCDGGVMSKIIKAALDPSCLMCQTPSGWWSPLRRTNGVDTGIYGVIYDPSIATALRACTRVCYNESTDTLHLVNSFESLPAHNFRRCVMDDLSARHVNYYLDANDSTKKADETASDLTGVDGDVMVEIPVTYQRVQTMTDGRILYLVSNREFSGAAPHPFFYVSPDGATLRTQYVGAYQSTICDASGARIANMMNQDATAPTAYSAGYKARSVAGCKPWTGMTQASHRTAAANNGGFGVNSLFHQYLMLMMLIEGGSFDTQTTISPGFSYASTWNYVFTRLSGRADFGNGTGSVPVDPAQDAAITWKSVVDALKVVQFSYRGIENPYGEIWKIEDGIQKYQNIVDGALTDGCYWWTAAINDYTDVDQNAAALPVYTRISHAWPASGWEKTWSPNSFFPLAVGGGSSTYMCDYFYNDAAAGARAVLRGASVTDGAIAGVSYVDVSYGLAAAYTRLGGRLAC